jgi:pSer/pThr/pTyr-binding forkhead associated (FHA) protein
MPSLILITETPERHVCPLGRATLMVGSGDKSDLHLPSSSISGDHASIIFENTEFVLKDNGSSNGSFVNGAPVRDCVLKHQDLVRFGEYLFMVDMEDDQTAHLDEAAPSTENETAAASSAHSSGTSQQQAVAGVAAQNEPPPTAGAGVATVDDDDEPKYSSVLEFNQPSPKSSQEIANLSKRTSANIKVLLTEPVAYQPTPSSSPSGAKPKRRSPRPVASSGAVRPQVTYKERSSSLLVQLLLVPIAVVLTAFYTLYMLPIEARAILVNSEGFQRMPFSGTVSSLIFRAGDKKERIVNFKPGVPHEEKMTVTQDALVSGRLHLGKIPAQPIDFHLAIYAADQTRPILEKTITTKPKEEYVPLFALTLPRGEYRMDYHWKPPASDPNPISLPSNTTPSLRDDEETGMGSVSGSDENDGESEEPQPKPPVARARSQVPTEREIPTTLFLESRF